MIDIEKANFAIGRMCDLLGVSRSGFYKWAARQGGDPSERERRTEQLRVKIRRFHAESGGVNGAPRILADLREDGEVLSRKTVAKIMRAEHLAGVSPRAFVPVTTIPDQAPHNIPDLVRRDFDQGAVNKVWTSDITTWAPEKDGCTCVPFVTGIPVEYWDTRSRNHFTPMSWRQPCGERSYSATGTPAGSSSMQTEAANTHPCSWLWPRKNSRFAFRSGGPEYVGTMLKSNHSGRP